MTFIHSSTGTHISDWKETIRKFYLEDNLVDKLSQRLECEIAPEQTPLMQTTVQSLKAEWIQNLQDRGYNTVRVAGDQNLDRALTILIHNRLAQMGKVSTTTSSPPLFELEWEPSVERAIKRHWSSTPPSNSSSVPKAESLFSTPKKSLGKKQTEEKKAKIRTAKEKVPAQPVPLYFAQRNDRKIFRKVKHLFTRAQFCYEKLSHLSQKEKNLIKKMNITKEVTCKTSQEKQKQQNAISLIENEIENTKIQMNEASERYLEDLSQLKELERSQFGDQFFSIAIKQSCRFAKPIPERIYNFLENRRKYLKQINLMFNEPNFKRAVLEKFIGLRANVDRINIDIRIYEADPHNGAKVPLLIRFLDRSSGEELGKIVYKPRKADTDIAVVKLFRKLNHVSPRDKQLPTLLIKNLRGNQGSVWEFVPGITVGEGTAPANKASKSFIKRLDQVSRKIGLADLHGGNVIIGLDGKDSLTVIDFEDLSTPNRYTWLKGNQPQTPSPLRQLPDRQELLIKEFLSTQDNREARFIPIATIEFQSAIHDANSDEIASAWLPKVIQGIISRGYELKIKPRRLRALLLQAHKQMDIPYFTKLRGNIFYGPSSAGIVVAIPSTRSSEQNSSSSSSDTRKD